MCETIRGIIVDMFAVLGALCVMGVVFYVYNLGVRHIHEELDELRQELSFITQRNLELEKKVRFLEERGDKKCPLNKDGKSGPSKISSALKKFTLHETYKNQGEETKTTFLEDRGIEILSRQKDNQKISSAAVKITTDVHIRNENGICGIRGLESFTKIAEERGIENFSQKQDDEICYLNISSYLMVMPREVITRQNIGTCGRELFKMEKLFARDVSDLGSGTCLHLCEEISQNFKRRGKRKGVKHKRKVNLKRTSVNKIKRKSHRSEKSEKVAKCGLRKRHSKVVSKTFDAFCQAIMTCITKHSVKARERLQTKGDEKSFGIAVLMFRHCKTTTKRKRRSSSKGKATSKPKRTSKRLVWCNTFFKGKATGKSITKYQTNRKASPVPKVKIHSIFASRSKVSTKRGRKCKAVSRPRGIIKTTVPKVKTRFQSVTKVKQSYKKAPTYDTRSKATTRSGKKLKPFSKKRTHSKVPKTRATLRDSKSRTNPKLSKTSARPEKVSKASAPKMKNTRTAAVRSVRKPQAPRRSSASHTGRRRR